MLKRNIQIIIVGLLLLGLVNTSFGSSVIWVENCFFNNEGKTYFYANELASALGYNYQYNTQDKKIVFVSSKDMQEAYFYLGSNIATINGKNIAMKDITRLNNLKVALPLEALELLSLKAFYNRFNNSYIILKNQNGQLEYKVQGGDSLWKLSIVFGTSVDEIKRINGLSTDSLYVGQVLMFNTLNNNGSSIQAYTKSSATVFSKMSLSSSAVGYLKAWTKISITGKDGDWFKANTPKGEGYLYKTVVSIPQEIYSAKADDSYFERFYDYDKTGDYKNYIYHTVKNGETIWGIGETYGIDTYEINTVNGFNSSTVVYPGMSVKIPRHIIGIKKPLSEGYGEILDWYTQGRYVFSVNATGKVIDLATGKSFLIKRTIGANHADVETLTYQDTLKMKEIFNGSWSWERRACLLIVDGRTLAVSIAGMPHAGVDGLPFLQNVYNRSDDYGYGPNYDSIAGNGMNGHFDLYFLNSLKHKDNSVDGAHQHNVLISGGLR